VDNMKKYAVDEDFWKSDPAVGLKPVTAGSM
jgi:hypothetical protein